MQSQGISPSERKELASAIKAVEVKSKGAPCSVVMCHGVEDERRRVLISDAACRVTYVSALHSVD